MACFFFFVLRAPGFIFLEALKSTMSTVTKLGRICQNKKWGKWSCTTDQHCRTSRTSLLPSCPPRKLAELLVLTSMHDHFNQPAKDSSCVSDCAAPLLSLLACQTQKKKDSHVNVLETKISMARNAQTLYRQPGQTSKFACARRWPSGVPLSNTSRHILDPFIYKGVQTKTHDYFKQTNKKLVTTRNMYIKVLHKYLKKVRKLRKRR